jgi:hypothetical protein
MTTPNEPNVTRIGVAPLEAVIVAATVAMCGSAIGRVVLQVVFDVLAKRESSVQAVTWILGGVSVRFFVAHALAAEVFMTAYPRLPTVRRQLAGEKGTLIVGAVLGTLMWVVLRALLPSAGPALLGIVFVSWLTMALVSGPIIVWIARGYVTTSSTDVGSREARREIGYGLSIILPAVLVLLWGFGTEGGAGMGVAVAFVGFAALAVIVVGTSKLLGGLSKARGITDQRWARATPYLIAVALVILALALS